MFLSNYQPEHNTPATLMFTDGCSVLCKPNLHFSLHSRSGDAHFV